LAAQAALDDINAALARLADGCYGYCEQCRQQIPA
jgi:RNA polymerase-binding transcription factor DksA